MASVSAICSSAYVMPTSAAQADGSSAVQPFPPNVPACNVPSSAGIAAAAGTTASLSALPAVGGTSSLTPDISSRATQLMRPLYQAVLDGKQDEIEKAKQSLRLELRMKGLSEENIENVLNNVVLLINSRIGLDRTDQQYTYSHSHQDWEKFDQQRKAYVKAFSDLEVFGGKQLTEEQREFITLLKPGTIFDEEKGTDVRDYMAKIKRPGSDETLVDWKYRIAGDVSDRLSIIENQDGVRVADLSQLSEKYKTDVFAPLAEMQAELLRTLPSEYSELLISPSSSASEIKVALVNLEKRSDISDSNKALIQTYLSTLGRINFKLEQTQRLYILNTQKGATVEWINSPQMHNLNETLISSKKETDAARLANIQLDNICQLIDKLNRQGTHVASLDQLMQHLDTSSDKEIITYIQQLSSASIKDLNQMIVGYDKGFNIRRAAWNVEGQDSTLAQIYQVQQEAYRAFNNLTIDSAKFNKLSLDDQKLEQEFAGLIDNFTAARIKAPSERYKAFIALASFYNQHNQVLDNIFGHGSFEQIERTMDSFKVIMPLVPKLMAEMLNDPNMTITEKDRLITFAHNFMDHAGSSISKAREILANNSNITDDQRNQLNASVRDLFTVFHQSNDEVNSIIQSYYESSGQIKGSLVDRDSSIQSPAGDQVRKLLKESEKQMTSLVDDIARKAANEVSVADKAAFERNQHMAAVKAGDITAA